VFPNNRDSVHVKLLPVCTVVLVSLAAVCVRGQTDAASGNQSLQPSPASLPSASAAAPASTAGAVRGEIDYPDQAPIAGAQLTLTPASGPAMKAVSEADGTFVFEQVPPGPFTLRISAHDVETASATGTLAPSAVVQLPTVTMRLAAVHTDVTAITQHEAAEREVKTEESQRILKAIPNFMVVYDSEPVPLSAREKFRLSTRTLIDPVTIGVSAAIAGGELESNAYPGFGRGAAGYARRFGASVGDSTSGMLLAGAVLPTVFHQDPRYFYRGTGSRGSRLVYVLKQTVEQKGDNGHWQFAWSNTLGSVGSALISETYYPQQPGQHWGSSTGQLFGLGLASTGISNLLQEFVFGRITTHRAP
jgi:hypothetical protein